MSGFATGRSNTSWRADARLPLAANPISWSELNWTAWKSRGPQRWRVRDAATIVQRLAPFPYRIRSASLSV